MQFVNKLIAVMDIQATDISLTILIHVLSHDQNITGNRTSMNTDPIQLARYIINRKTFEQALIITQHEKLVTERPGPDDLIEAM